MQKRILSLAALFCATTALTASADTIKLKYDTFGGYTATDFASPPTPDMGTAVANGNSATLTTNPNNPVVGALFMDTFPNATADFVSLSFGINILSQAASGYGQNFGGAETLGGVRIFQNADWAVSFQFMPTSATTGTFAFRNSTNTGVQTLGTYNTNTLYNIQIDVNYLTGGADAYINGTLAGSNFPLRPSNAPGGTTSEIFVYLNGSAGSANSIFLADAVPLPTVASSTLVGLASLTLARRRK